MCSGQGGSCVRELSVDGRVVGKGVQWSRRELCT